VIEIMVRPGRFERPTFCSGGSRSLFRSITSSYQWFCSSLHFLRISSLYVAYWWGNQNAVSLQRLRSDRRLGLPEKGQREQWAGICERRGIHRADDILAVLDTARVGVNRPGEWRNWNFLTIQVQLAAERFQVDESQSAQECLIPDAPRMEEDPTTEWARAKGQIRESIPKIPFLNWFDGTRQIQRCGTRVLVEVPDEPTRSFLEREYAREIRCAVARFGIEEICYVVRDGAVPN
jgi:hypothetical protein